MGQYLLGIDNGNTISKVAIFDLNGKEQHVASCSVETEYAKPGWTERSMAGFWQGVATAIRETLAKAAIDPAEIVGIGCSGHGNGLYLLDKAGQPLGNGIQSLDTRASSIVDGWHEVGLHRQVFSQTLQALWPAQPNALLAWLKTHEPARYESIGAVLLCKDYVNYRLTDQIRTDYSDISATSLFDVPRKEYSKELLYSFGIPEIYEALPRLAHSFEVIGQVTAAAAAATGLAVGTPVVGGMFDVDASAVGAGVYRPGQACLIAGTWSINEVVTAEPVIDPNLFMTTIFSAPETWLTIEASPTSATNLEWFVTQFCAEERLDAEKRGISVFEVCSEAVASIAPDNANIIFHPFLYGSNVQANARSGFYGVAGWHTRAHLLRALFEGVVFSHLNHIEKLRAAGANFDIARLTGGGSRSKVWAQMFADILGTPIEIPDGTETGARGAALSAGIGAGVYNSYDEAVDQAVSVVRTHEPISANIPLYLARYEAYKHLVEAMQPSWDHLAGLQR
ncbi:MAG: carbohydrate kinase [Anaerolineae bacterium]|nr:carbohydrate kinase [Anaerolineae bacterium]MCB9103616.1 carbohydrate kinase [Anaerolineales bacterium]